MEKVVRISLARWRDPIERHFLTGSPVKELSIRYGEKPGQPETRPVAAHKSHQNQGPRRTGLKRGRSPAPYDSLQAQEGLDFFPKVDSGPPQG